MKLGRREKSVIKKKKKKRKKKKKLGTKDFNWDLPVGDVSDHQDNLCDN